MNPQAHWLAHWHIIQNKYNKEYICSIYSTFVSEKQNHMNLTKKDIEAFVRFQRNEITESIVYDRLASIEKNASNRKVLKLISGEEKAHYHTLKEYTNIDVKPDHWRIAKYYWLARLLGITFAIKLMESSEDNAHRDYAKYTDCEDLQRLSHEEEAHEEKLIELINEERLEYMGSVGRIHRRTGRFHFGVE